MIKIPNALTSSKNPAYATPDFLWDWLCYSAGKAPDLDPFSSEQANAYRKERGQAAKRILTADTPNGGGRNVANWKLKPGDFAIVNPPGGRGKENLVSTGIGISCQYAEDPSIKIAIVLFSLGSHLNKVTRYLTKGSAYLYTFNKRLNYLNDYFREDRNPSKETGIVCLNFRLDSLISCEYARPPKDLRVAQWRLYSSHKPLV